MELQSLSSYSQISTYSAVYAHKAWHIVSLILSLGRPACPAEVAEQCRLFRSSPQVVEFLCWIPNSPLVLTDNGLVTLSFVALVAFGRFLTSSMLRVKIGGWMVPRSLGGNVIRTYYRKRKRSGKLVVPFLKKGSGSRPVGEVQDEDQVPAFEWKCGVEGNSFQPYDDLCTLINSIVNVPTSHIEATAFNWGNFSNEMLVNPLKLNYSHPTMNIEDKEGGIEQNTSVVDHVNLHESQPVCLGNCVHQSRRVEHLEVHPLLVQRPSLASPGADSIPLEGTYIKNFMGDIANHDITNHSLSCMQVDELCHLKLVESPCARNVSEDRGDVGMMELETGHDVSERKFKYANSPYSTIERVAPSKSDLYKESMNYPENKIIAEGAMKNSKCSLSVCEQPVTQNLQRKSPAKTIKHQQDVLAEKLKDMSKPLEQTHDVVPKGKRLRGPTAVPLKHKTKQIPNDKISIPERTGNFHFNSSKNHLDSKALPKFDLYTLEEEEGSGGYGTVYRVWRKSDGIKFAIKYPHPNANKHHVDNERRMLERFGGKSYVIKYEGSCRSENSDCFVLKHVEHDRPDVLKKEITICELQWYCYCMFTALSSLHKQGVVHRDVKPGNFLFSRKTCLGYIIDFNLAKDLHQKQTNTGNFSNPHLKAVKTVSPSKRRKTLDTKASELASGGLTRGFKSIESKMLGKKALNASYRNSVASQGADGSGLTSAKDLTSTRTPSAERLREPLPCQGRKELINLAQEAMQSPKQELAGVPAYKRKRIAAPPVVMARKLVYYSPMPIHSSGIAVPGSGFLKERGEGKVQKEGPCAGTKGFRAPEVLLRSMHQGPKLDVWSAGVTLLYLVTGKMAFTGEPEQNMKDIVKLRGSEELWELAKLHSRESSFPEDLYDVRFLQSMDLRDWCKANTKRPEFLDAIPSSLFDLIDKCLTVSPRLRISAEDALKHEFLAPCVDVVRKRKLLKQHSVEWTTKRENHTDGPSISEAVKAL